MFWRRKKAQPPFVSCFGKLPATGDFIRLNATSDEFAAFDQWMGASINLARESLGPGFEQAYVPAVGLFMFHGPAPKGNEPERGLVGVWAASGDNAGRHYPMVVCASYDYAQLVSAGAALPIATWTFLTAAYNLVAMGRGLQVDDFLSRVAQIQPPSLENTEVATAAYHEWLQHQSMRGLWETGFGSEAIRFWVIHNIVASVEIFRGQELPETSLAIRYPIGAGDTYAASVWMDITMRLAGWQRTLFNAYWTPQRDLLVHMGQPHVATFRELIAPTRNAEHITDLHTPPSIVEAEARERLGPELAKLVDQTDMRIDVFLRSLS